VYLHKASRIQLLYSAEPLFSGTFPVSHLSSTHNTAVINHMSQTQSTLVDK